MILGSAAFVLACAFRWHVRPSLVIRAIAAGRIRWDDITGIRLSTLGSQSFVTIDVVDPRRFVGRGGALRRLLNRAYAAYGRRR